MKSHVDFKSTSSGILLVAAWMRALERFKSSVSQLMRLQMALCYKTLLTLGAAERPLTRVGSHVRFEIACLSKLLKTVCEGTNKQFDLMLWSLDSLNVY